jgi:carboxyl-terminal processing protease
VVLLAVMPESPAETAGLDAHDSVVAVDGDAVTVEEGQNVVQRIRGPAGSDVTLRVRSPGRSERDITVTRGRITASDVLRGGLLGDGRIGYLLLPAATSEDLADDIVTAIQALHSRRALAGLVLDLRIASVRGTWPLMEMMTLFADGELGEIFERDTAEPIVVSGQNISHTQTLPLAIIVGPDTQGAPEIFAAAMQSIGRATIVGMPTLGQVEVVKEFPLPDGSRVFIATGSYRTPRGRDIGQAGIQPDVEVDLDWDQVTDADDPVRTAAARALTSR